MVLVEEAHDILGPVGHVLSNQEGVVTTRVHLEGDNLGSHSISSPLSIFEISKDVVFTNEECGRYAGVVLKRDKRSDFLFTNVERCVVFRSPELESVLNQVLSVVQQTLERSGASRMS